MSILFEDGFFLLTRSLPIGYILSESRLVPLILGNCSPLVMNQRRLFSLWAAISLFMSDQIIAGGALADLHPLSY